MTLGKYLRGMGAIAFSYSPSSLKVAVYRLFGAKIGENVTLDIGSFILLKDGGLKGIDIGDNCVIERYATALGLARFKMGDDSLIARDTKIIGDRSFSLGKKSSIGFDCFIDARDDVSIGEQVSIASYCMLITHSEHSTDEYEISEYAPVKIGDGAWLGAGSTVLAGVTVGKNAVVGAGAVVTKDVPPAEVHAGVPAKKIKDMREVSGIRFRR